MTDQIHHNRRLAWGLVPMAAVAFILARTFPPKPPPPPPPAAPTAPTPAAAATEEEPPPPSPAPSRPERRAGSRQILPRPAPIPGAAGGGGAEEAAQDSGEDALPERGRMAPPEVPFTPEAIQGSLEAVTPDIQGCVSEWLEAGEGEALDGRVVLEVVLGPEGVAEAALVDVEGVPAPMLGCFGGVIYEVEWPRPDQPTTIRYPFVVTDEDPGEE